VKLIVLVEGHTEHRILPNFFSRWFDGKLECPIAVKTILFDGWSRLNRDLEKSVSRYLSESKDVAAVASLIDLYGPTIYPPSAKTAEQRLEWITRHFEERVGDKRYRAFFAVHETEAWLLSKPAIFPRSVAEAMPKKATAAPETVNFDNPPAKLLESLYRQHMRSHYKKNVDGIKLFLKLSPDDVIAKCPNFTKMMESLLELVKANQ